MTTFWACFESIGDHLFRFDTRVYLNSVASCHADDPIIGAIVAKNPGSAKPDNPHLTGLQSVALANDKLLPTVRGIVAKSFDKAGQIWPERGFVQVFNLFYLCDKDAGRARRIALQLDLPTCPNETRKTPWLWYAWGEMGSQLPELSTRFARLHAANRFYFDKQLNEVRTGHPTNISFPKHTQGLLQVPVIAHLAVLLGSTSHTSRFE
jgi:hypothetical protein